MVLALLITCCFAFSIILAENVYAQDNEKPTLIHLKVVVDSVW
jgi:hypothetical protein